MKSKIRIIDGKRVSDDIVCPYCGSIAAESWDYSDGSDNVYCEECGATYGYEREVSVTYSSYKVKEGKPKEVKTLDSLFNANDVLNIKDINPVEEGIKIFLESFKNKKT